MNVPWARGCDPNKKCKQKAGNEGHLRSSHCHLQNVTSHRSLETQTRTISGHGGGFDSSGARL